MMLGLHAISSPCVLYHDYFGVGESCVYLAGYQFPLGMYLWDCCPAIIADSARYGKHMPMKLYAGLCP